MPGEKGIMSGSIFRRGILCFDGGSRLGCDSIVDKILGSQGLSTRTIETDLTMGSMSHH